MRGPRHLGSPCWTRPGLAGRAGGQTTSSRFRTEGRRVRSLLAHPLQRALQTQPASPPAISPAPPQPTWSLSPPVGTSEARGILCPKPPQKEAHSSAWHAAAEVPVTVLSFSLVVTCGL